MERRKIKSKEKEKEKEEGKRERGEEAEEGEEKKEEEKGKEEEEEIYLISTSPSLYHPLHLTTLYLTICLVLTHVFINYSSFYSPCHFLFLSFSFSISSYLHHFFLIFSLPHHIFSLLFLALNRGDFPSCTL